MVGSFQTKGARNKIDNASDVKLDDFSPWHAIKRLEHPSNCLTIANRRGSSTGGRRQSEQERHQDRRRSFGASNPRPSFSLDSPMWICLRPAPTSPRLCSTSRIGIVFISSWQCGHRSIATTRSHGRKASWVNTRARAG